MNAYEELCAECFNILSKLQWCAVKTQHRILHEKSTFLPQTRKINCCAICNSDEEQGHAEDCALAELLNRLL